MTEKRVKSKAYVLKTMIVWITCILNGIVGMKMVKEMFGNLITMSIMIFVWLGLPVILVIQTSIKTMELKLQPMALNVLIG